MNENKGCNDLTPFLLKHCSKLIVNRAQLIKDILATD
jgi:hypothetical protein